MKNVTEKVIKFGLSLLRPAFLVLPPGLAAAIAAILSVLLVLDVGGVVAVVERGIALNGDPVSL